jgi:hypothetical protein
LVLHATIDKTTYAYTAGQSPYGFAFNGGANLPAPLTIATDQALYSQGDWNIDIRQSQTPPSFPVPTTAIAPTAKTPLADKQPASFLADSITVLSNECLATTDTVANTNVTTALGTSILPPSLSGQLNCGALNGGMPPVVANQVSVSAAFLSNTDTSIPGTYYSGGLNNYMRILEDWRGVDRAGRNLNYAGSFVSLGAPLEVSGQYRAWDGTANSYASPPVRNWAYDTSFNSYQGLPPLPPKVTELQQDSFRRKFN